MIWETEMKIRQNQQQKMKKSTYTHTHWMNIITKLFRTIQGNLSTATYNVCWNIFIYKRNPVGLLSKMLYVKKQTNTQHIAYYIQFKHSRA